jgi:hypothetical protein
VVAPGQEQALSYASRCKGGYCACMSHMSIEPVGSQCPNTENHTVTYTMIAALQ